jgi:hypothetical protein
MRRTLLLLLLLPVLLLPGAVARALCLCGMAGEERRPRCCSSCHEETPPLPGAPERDPTECEGCVAVPLVFDVGSRPELPRPEPLALVLVPPSLPEAPTVGVVLARGPEAATAHPPPPAAFRLPLRI